MWRRFKSSSVLLRLVPFLIVMAAGVVVAMLGYPFFVSSLAIFLSVLLLILVPWSAVSLADYFVVRRARYDVGAFFSPHGSYGRVCWRGLLAYALGLAAEWLLAAHIGYTGPLVRYLGGADISWPAGWVVAGAAYLLFMRGAASTEPGRAAVPAVAAGTR
jgi:NCS1 family nucleobase:cation symporter-1